MNKRLKLLVHPYIFVLKEGRDIQGNFLDYNLLMLQVNCPETIRSPKNDIDKSIKAVSEFDLIKANLKNTASSLIDMDA